MLYLLLEILYANKIMSSYQHILGFKICNLSHGLFLKSVTQPDRVRLLINSASNEVIRLHLMHFFFLDPQASAIN